MLSERFDEALVFAHMLHRAQTRKNAAIPYIAHLLTVAATVLEHGGGEDEAIAALLHDAVEDQGGLETRDRIAGQFGATVAEIVMGCTDTFEDPKPAWRPRKEAWLARLVEAPAPVRLVAAADKLHNARSILADYRTVGDAVWERFNGGRAGMLWYHRALADDFLARGPQALAAEIERVVRELEDLAASQA